MIAFLVYAGLVKVCNEIENYWSVKTLYHGLWAREIIYRFRYKAFMAFNNCTSHRRILLLMNAWSNQGIGGIRQFMKDNPTKWGINLWVATDSSDGYTCNFEIYTGKKSRDSSQHGLEYDVVM